MSGRGIVRGLPIDVLLVLVAIGAAYLAVGFGAGSPVRVAIALGFILFVPGYALSTALFPATLAPDRRRHRHPLGPARGAALDGIERLAASFGFSLVLLPLFGLVMTALSWALTPGNILTMTSGFTLVATLVGAVRRARLPPDARHEVPVRDWIDGASDRLGREPAVDAVVNLVLALAVVTATAALAVAVVAPQEGGTYTDLTLMTPTEGGDPVAADYPTEFTEGAGEPLVLEVANHEGRTVHYTVVVRLERLDDRNRVVQADELDRFEKQLPAAATWQIRHTVTPTMAGDDLRLTYLLYEGEPPETPHTINSYRHVYLWINVSA